MIATQIATHLSAVELSHCNRCEESAGRTDCQSGFEMFSRSRRQRDRPTPPVAPGAGAHPHLCHLTCIPAPAPAQNNPALTIRSLRERFCHRGALVEAGLTPRPVLGRSQGSLGLMWRFSAVFPALRAESRWCGMTDQTGQPGSIPGICFSSALSAAPQSFHGFLCAPRPWPYNSGSRRLPGLSGACVGPSPIYSGPDNFGFWLGSP